MQVAKTLCFLGTMCHITGRSHVRQGSLAAKVVGTLQPFADETWLSTHKRSFGCVCASNGFVEDKINVQNNSSGSSRQAEDETLQQLGSWSENTGTTDGCTLDSKETSKHYKEYRDRHKTQPSSKTQRKTPTVIHKGFKVRLHMRALLSHL